MISNQIVSFKDIIRNLLRDCTEKFGQLLAGLLEQLDEELAKEARAMGLESVGKRKRELITLFGVVVSYRRHGYRRRGMNGGRCVYLLDELLGVKEEERFCPLLQIPTQI